MNGNRSTMPKAPSAGRRIAILATAVAVVAASGATIASGGGDPPAIRPGTETNACTLGFLFRSATNATWYASTAGHCVEGTGQTIYVWDDGPVIGQVVARRNDGFDDWALIRVREGSERYLNASVRHWTGPRRPDGHGVYPPQRVCHYGHGDLYEWTETTRHRCGKIQGFRSRDSITMVEFRSRTWAGDSGSPVIHYGSGEAVGLLTKGWPGYFSMAIDVCSLLDRFAAQGYNLTLATASYDPPPADPTVPGPTVSLEGRRTSPCL